MYLWFGGELSLKKTEFSHLNEIQIEFLSGLIVFSVFFLSVCSPPVYPSQSATSLVLLPISPPAPRPLVNLVCIKVRFSVQLSVWFCYFQFRVQLLSRSACRLHVLRSSCDTNSLKLKYTYCYVIEGYFFPPVITGTPAFAKQSVSSVWTKIQFM